MKFIQSCLAILICSLFSGLNIYGQEAWLQGDFPSKYFSQKDLGASPQIKTGSIGPNKQVFVGNNTGVLVYNGHDWTKIHLEKNNLTKSERTTIDDDQVLRIHHHSNSKTYIGRKKSFGYIAESATGELVYHPIFLKDANEEFIDMYGIYSFKADQLLLVAPKSFWQIKNDKVVPFHFPKGLEKSRCKSITNFFGNYLIRFEKRDKKGAITENKRFVLNAITGQYTEIFLPEEHSNVDFRWEIQTENGVHLFSESGIELKVKKQSKNKYQWITDEKESLFSRQINDKYVSHVATWGDYVVFGTKRGGVYFCDKTGGIIRKIDLSDGMESTVVSSFNFDHQGNLWVYLENGVYFIELSSPISSYKKDRGIKATVQAISVSKDASLLLGLNPDLGFPIKNSAERVMFSNPVIFNEVIFDIDRFDTDFGLRNFVITFNGIYEFSESTKQKKHITNAAAWSFLQSPIDRNKIFVGTVDGIGCLTVSKDQVSYTDILSSVGGDVRNIVFKNNKLFFGVFKKGIGVYDLIKKEYKVIPPPESIGKKTNYFLQTFDDQIFIGCNTGLFVLNEAKGVFQPFDKIEDQFQDPNLSIHRIFNDHEKRLWIVWNLTDERKGAERFIGYIEKENGLYRLIQKPFHLLRNEGVINDMAFPEKGNTWLAGYSGLFNYNHSIAGKIQSKFKTYINEISINGKTICYNPDFVSSFPEIEYKDNTIKFSINTDSYYGLGKMQYAYRLSGEEWSTYSESSSAEFPKLTEGNYLVKFRAKDIYGNISEVKTFSFKVLPPWYRAWYAYLAYLLLFVGIIALATRISTLRIKRQNQLLELTVKNRTKEIAEQNEQLEIQKTEITRKSNDILDSIKYAKRIQDTILPSKAKLSKMFKDHFVMFHPKDIVSGDFYWAEEFGDNILFAAVDCTGHGVPGALVSIVGNNGITRATNEFQLTEPAPLLNKLRELVIQSFHADGHSDVKDGMDIALCSINKKTLLLKFAGANNECVIVRNKVIIQLQPDKQPIGEFIHQKDFTQKEFQLQPNDSIYIFSDGFLDQFGGEKGKKFKSRPFRELLASISDQPMKDQYDFITKAFREWIGDHEQIDDVCVIGVRV